MAIAVCLRCEWSGAAPSGRSCPRCGVRLFRSEPARVAPARVAPARPATPRPPSRPTLRRDLGPPTPGGEARVVSPAQRPAPGRARWRGWAALAALLALASAAVLAPRGSPLGGPEDPGAPTGAMGGAPPQRLLAVPPEVADLTAPDPVAITLAAVPDATEAAARLWRLELPRGRLSPGPLVGGVRRIANAPRPHDERIAFLEDGGGLFVLDGFTGQRPAWVAGGVDAFDFDDTGALVFAATTQRSVRDGTTVTDVRFGRLDAGAIHPALDTVATVSYPIEVLAVRRGSVFVWGTEGGRHVLTTIRAGGSGAAAEHAVDATGSLPGGGTLPDEGAEASSPRGTLVVRGRGHELVVTGADAGATGSIGLPEDLPTLGPIAVG